MKPEWILRWRSSSQAVGPVPTILDREHPPQLTAVIDEAALQRFAEGCAGVVAGQLRHLVACTRRPHIRVHVLPQGEPAGTSPPGAVTTPARASRSPTTLPGRVHVRDSKDRDGGLLTFTPAAWRAFVELARTP